MFSPEVKDWVSVLAPSLSVLAAITALGLSARLAYAQRRIQEMQLKERQFERRYAVFLAVEEFLMYVLRENGSVKLLGEEFRRFRYAREQAEFLFEKTDVSNYMSELNETVKYLFAKAVDRDKLTLANQNDQQLNLEITNLLIKLGGPFVERRKKVFGPYLQLSPSETVERSAEQMRLNGWHRLWIVVAVVWLLPVILFSYASWPTTASISKGDVYSRMNPDDTQRLTDYDPMTSSGITGPTVDVDGHIIQFVQAIPKEDMKHTALAYQSALLQILGRKRAGLVGEAFALWMIPIIALYLLGWAIRWVRRGFLAA